MSGRSTRKPTREPRRPSRGRATSPGCDESPTRRFAEPRRRAGPMPADFWDEAEVVAPTRSVRSRSDWTRTYLEWFRRSGPRYQTRMNAVLRMYVKRMRKHA